ncbi:YigZ family protein [uncultured Megasphaera sp.]|uniref:YigZ family protein n=1 Tax=Megasphaera massiliensis TaxID=1232428 RepID=UPI00266CD1D5|nr:YigZ family protein [uncultured Megasphaera sp.]
MESLLRSVYGRAEAEYVIKKSRFIATVCEVKTEQEATAFIESVRKHYWDARHNCSAFQIGAGGQIQRSSDDGEPSGTAGRPILEVLKKRDLTNTAVVVTRYFGGIKLGASGLIRAYSHAATLALDEAFVVVYTPFTLLTATVAYPLVSTLERFAESHCVLIADRAFAADVTFTFEVPEGDIDTFIADLTNTANGRVNCKKTGTVVKPVPVTET